MAKIATLTDTFATLDAAKFTPGGTAGPPAAVASIVSGALRLEYPNLSGSHCEYTSVARNWDLTASSIMVEIPDAGPQQTGWETWLFLGSGATSFDYNNYLGIAINAANGVLAELNNGGGAREVGVGLGTAYSPTAHRWLQIRETSGVIYWEYSATGDVGSWTTLHSVPSTTATFSLTTLFVELYVTHTTAAGAVGYSVFDNLNIAPAAPATSGWQLGLSARGGPVDTPTPPPSGTAFPLLGGLLMSGPQDYDNTTYQAQIAKLDVGIFGMYPGWGTLAARQAAVNAVKALNPSIKLGNYTSVNEINSSASNVAALRTKLAGESSAGGRDWYLYLANGSTHASGFAGMWSINLSLTSTTPGADGDRWPQYKAKWDKTNLFDGVNFDIQFSDNCFEDPPIDADWNCDGVLDGVTSTTVRNTMRDGYRAHYDTVKSVQPTKILMVNTDTDMKGDVYPGGLSIPQYTNVVHAVLLEQLTGQTWSVEQRTPGWAGMMSWYHAVFNNILAPKMVLFNWGGFAAGTAGYQTHRYMFASCLLDNGYYCASNTSYHDVLWFDEFDLNGAASTKWLGAAIDPPPTTAWSSGVYRREFENGLALVNPKGNGIRTVTVGAGWHKVAGSRDAVNSGATVTSVTLADRDGLILVRSSLDPSVNVRDHGVTGNGTTDDTAAINAVIAAHPGETIRFPSGTYKVSATTNVAGVMTALRLNSAGTKLVIDAGATLALTNNSYTDYAVVYVSAPDCQITGTGTIRGDVPGHTGSTGEWGHCIWITTGADRCLVRGITASHAWGDGVLVMGYVADVTIQSVTCDNNRRQGISVIDSLRTQILGCTINNTGAILSTAPGAGIDIEPDPATTRKVIDFLVADCTLDNNLGGGVMTSSNGRTVTGVVQDCTATNSGTLFCGGFEVFDADPDTDVAFLRCTAIGNDLCGFKTVADAPGVDITDCVATANTQDGYLIGGPNATLLRCDSSNNGRRGFHCLSTATGLHVTECNSLHDCRSTPTATVQFDIYSPGATFTDCTSVAGTPAPYADYGYAIRPGATGVTGTGNIGSGAFVDGVFVNLSGSGTWT